MNTRGKEVLSSYDNLALLNLPIRNSTYYKLQSIGVYGVDIILELNEARQERNNTTWFKDSKIQQVYEGTLLAEMLQIVHRSSLRRIKDNSKVNIFIYTHLIGWGKKVKAALLLSETALSIKIVGDKYKFIENCKRYAESTYQFLCKMSDCFNNPSYSAGEIIKGEAFKKFINSHWKNSDSKQQLIEVFEKAGVEICCEEINNKLWKKFRLKSEAYDCLF